MPEAIRPRQVEYYNPRPLILGICFFWGVAMGFCLYFFRAPEQTVVVQQPAAPTAPTAVLETPEQRRVEGVPSITHVDTQQAAPTRPRFETMEFPPPAPALTTAGGLSGRTATDLRPPARTQPTPSGRPVYQTTPPPIPELMP